MATEVVETEEVTLEDGTEVTIKPLVIKLLRKFMKTWNEWIETMEVTQNQREANEVARRNEEDLPYPEVPKLSKISDMEYDVYINLAMICFNKQLQGDKTDKQFREYIEDNVDQAVMYRAFARCAGLNLRADEENLTSLMNQAANEE